MELLVEQVSGTISTSYDIVEADGILTDRR